MVIIERVSNNFWFLQVSVAMGSQLDLMATYAELAGVPVPNRTLDSHSLVPILFGSGYESKSLPIAGGKGAK